MRAAPCLRSFFFLASALLAYAGGLLVGMQIHAMLIPDSLLFLLMLLL
jgi:hypothetical protein